MKVWYFICILFAWYSINNLIEDGSKITYVLSSDEEIKLNYRLACFNLKEIFSNKMIIDLQKLDEDAYAYFDNYFVNIIDRRFNKRREETKKDINESILNPIKSKNYFVLRDRFCLILKNNSIAVKYFKSLKYYILQKATYDLFKLKKLENFFDQIIVINKENSNCLNYYSKLKCLNQCYKRKNRLSKYIYNGNENGIIKIGLKKNSTIKKDEYECSNECNRNGCKLVHFETKRYGKSETKILRATFFVSNFVYYTQLIGLICLIVNISFYQLMPELILFLNLKTEKIKKRIKKLKIIKKVLKAIRRIKKGKIAKKLGVLKIKINRYLNLTKTMILLIGLAYFLHYSTTKIKERNSRMKTPEEYEIETYLVVPEILNLVVCTVVKGITEEHCRRKTLLQLEKATDRGFNDSISEIYLQFQNKKSKIKWRLNKDKVFFRYINSTNKTILRCLQIEIYPHEPKYQSLLAISKLKIKFKHDFYRLYLVSKDENFNSKSYEVIGQSNFIKKIEKRLKSNKKENCLDYKEAYSYCNSKKNCIDRCYSGKFVERYKNASYFATIDKEHFTVDQWNNSFLNFSWNYFSEINEECKMEFKKKIAMK